MTMMRWAAALVLLVAAGCGDDTSPMDDGGRDDAGGAEGGDEATGDEDGGEDAAADEGGATGTLTVAVRTAEYGDPASSGVAVGARVALDAPGGERREDVTGDDGRVTFDGIDWSLGTASVTAHLEGRIIFSRTGITEDDGEIPIALGILTPSDEWIDVSGTAANVPAESTVLEVGSNVFGKGSSAAPPDWEITVPPSEPFTLVAAARHCTSTTGREANCPIEAWQTSTHAGLTADTTVDLDFASPATPSTLHGSFSLPTAADSRLRTAGLGWVSVRPDVGSGVVGMTTHTLVTGDGNSIEFDLEYVEPEGVDAVTANYILLVGNNAWAMVTREGLPTAGSNEVDFLELPELVDPPNLTTRHPLHDPIVVEPPDPDGLLALWIMRDEEYLWWVQAPPGSTELTVPAAPSTVNEATYLGTGLVEGQLESAEQSDTSDLYLQRVSCIGPLPLEP